MGEFYFRGSEHQAPNGRVQRQMNNLISEQARVSFGFKPVFHANIKCAIYLNLRLITLVNLD